MLDNGKVVGFQSSGSNNIRTLEPFMAFFDFLVIEQTFDFDLPSLSKYQNMVFETATGEFRGSNQFPYVHEGSYCSKIIIKIRNRSLLVSGNPSRLNRLENFFGYTNLDEAVEAFNVVLSAIGLPAFTKCTKIFHMQSGMTGNSPAIMSDGAIIKRYDLTSNHFVGAGNEDAYIKAMSTQTFKSTIGKLHTDGKTAEWSNTLTYNKIYDKGYHLQKNDLRKAKRKYGKSSSEYKYISQIVDYCKAYGVVRKENELRNRYITKKRTDKLSFWGLQKTIRLSEFHQGFLELDKRIEAMAFDVVTIADRLLEAGLVDSQRQAFTCSGYAERWLAGEVFDPTHRTTKRWRPKLKKIGFDICKTCNISRFETHKFKNERVISCQPLEIPSWYGMPKNPYGQNVPYLRAM